MSDNLTNDFEVRRATLERLGGDTTGLSNIYEVDLAILDKTGQGGGGAQIDDNTISTGKVWSSSKTNTMINSAGMQVEIVSTLPATGEAKKIYLVPSSNPSTGNTYDEYMWINNSWELIGSTAVDLTNYYTKSLVDLAITTEDTSLRTWVGQQGYLTQHQSLAGYATETFVNNGLAGKVGSSNITTMISLTQAQYDALATKDASTFYVIVEATNTSSGDPDDDFPSWEDTDDDISGGSWDEPAI